MKTLALVVCQLLVLHPAAAQVSELSPEHWDPSARRYVEEFNNAWFEVQKPVATGMHGAITAASTAPAVYAGLQALEQGGSAVDAAVTTAFTQITLVAGSYVSYSGILNLVYYDKVSDRVYSLNAGYATPQEEHNAMSIPRERSGRNVLVPGFVAGAAAAHERFGLLPWSQLFVPAIYYAEHGFKVPWMLADMLKGAARLFQSKADTRAIFDRNDGTPYEAGDVFKQPQLAETLHGISEQGPDYFYRGPWAQHFVDAVSAEGGVITLDDMRDYAVIWSDPLRASYKSDDVYTVGLPGSGGVQLVEALNLANEAHLASMGELTQSPEAFYWWSQISNVAALTTARDATINALSSKLGLDFSLSNRATTSYAAKLWSSIQDGALRLARPPSAPAPAHTDAIVVIDQWGNIAALMHSLNDNPTDLYVDGVSINHSARFQQGVVAKVGPGNPVPSPGNPAIVFRSGKPYAATAAQGTGSHQASLGVLLRLLYDDADLHAAIDGPLIYLPTWSPDANTFATNVLADDFDPSLVEAAKARGLHVNVNRRPAYHVIGSVVGASIDPDSGQLTAIGSRWFNALPFAY